ncbi:LacI family DNA-binding transcriptional regulator [Glutamicibacter sp. PS]|uniref:LacI family DNA-binding transcriptional regulator n=1 Tax=Glutamicibacter sp. PS TaxID=3075634 RepID=UPI00284C9724|nr:LacI family DNA-binding transcriptional regulator [Glutamicibacter sp. PS]MDR4533977.1 LacI family transcriptional regulator [Glutamicibacter sp. PS]
MARAKKTTIHDVARAANVSITAVSHALNGKGTLSEQTRERIIHTAARIGYQADALARGLRNAPLGSIGVVYRSLDVLGEYFHPGVDAFSHTLSTMSALALQRGYAPMILPDLTGTNIPTISFALDGYVVISPHRADPVVELLRNRGIPYVTVGADPDRPEFTAWASEDDAESCTHVLEHLRRQGARHPVLLRGADENAWNIDSERAYLSWCHKYDLSPRVYRLAEASGVGGAAELLPRILGEGSVDAIYAMTARHACGVLHAATDLGLRVPHDLLVATGSDAESARFSRPAISAVQLNPDVVCADALDLLLEQISGQVSSGPRRCRAKFRARGSTLRK